MLRTLEKQDVMTPLCPRSNDPPMFVSDLIHAATRPWNMEVVREHMYEMDAEAVANIPISHVAQPERMEEDFSYHKTCLQLPKGMLDSRKTKKLDNNERAV